MKSTKLNNREINEIVGEIEEILKALYTISLRIDKLTNLLRSNITSELKQGDT